MNMRFFTDDSGAVTVDWVVLTAALVALGMAVISAIAPGINTATVDINQVITDAANYDNAAALAAAASSSP